MKMTMFEKIVIAILGIATISLIFYIGYIVGEHSINKRYQVSAKIATAQRDRLADYIRIYEDMQADNFDAADSISLHDFINEIEHEDNIDCMSKGMPPMHIDEWCYAY